MRSSARLAVASTRADAALISSRRRPVTAAGPVTISVSAMPQQLPFEGDTGRQRARHYLGPCDSMPAVRLPLALGASWRARDPYDTLRTTPGRNARSRRGTRNHKTRLIKNSLTKTRCTRQIMTEAGGARDGRCAPAAVVRCWTSKLVSRRAAPRGGLTIAGRQPRDGCYHPTTIWNIHRPGISPLSRDSQFVP